MSSPSPALAPAPSPVSPSAQALAAEAASAQQGRAGAVWHDHVPRTTAVLAVLAAVASGNYAGQFSKTILAQAEASDQWAYYQAKSIKRHLSLNQTELVKALRFSRTVDTAAAAGALAATPSHSQADDDALAKLGERSASDVVKYEQELKEIKAGADQIEASKRRHQKQGDRFQLAFVVLQAGVVLSTIAAGARRKELWIVAIVAGLGGLGLVGSAFLLGH
jgi:hypothetical protein